MSVRWHNIGDVRWNVINHHGQIRWNNEGDLRDGIALRAFCAGWDVATEVSLGDWGRIDVLATNGQETLVIEVKINVTQANQVRSACNQVSGYASQIEGVPGYRRPLVVAHDLNQELCDRMTKAIPVEVCCVGAVIAYMEKHGDNNANAKRIADMATVSALWQRWTLARDPEPERFPVIDQVLVEFSDAETLGDLTRDKRS